MDDWDMKVPSILWSYITTCKKITGKTPFRLVDGHKVVVPLDYLIPREDIEICIIQWRLVPQEEWPHPFFSQIRRHSIEMVHRIGTM